MREKKQSLYTNGIYTLVELKPMKLFAFYRNDKVKLIYDNTAINALNEMFSKYIFSKLESHEVNSNTIFESIDLKFSALLGKIFINANQKANVKMLSKKLVKE